MPGGLFRNGHENGCELTMLFLFWKIFFYFKTVSLYFYLGVSDNQNVIKFLQDPSSS